MKRWFLLIPIFCLIVATVLWRHEKNDSDIAMGIKDRTDASKEAASKRLPASVVPAPDKQQQTTPQAQLKPMPQIKAPEWVGNEDDLKNKDDVVFTNILKPDWKKKLLHSLQRGMPFDVKIEVKNERNVVLVDGHKATNANQVVVIFQGPGQYNSYRAMVNAQNGKIIRTWDHTIHEDTRSPASLTGLPLTN